MTGFLVISATFSAFMSGLGFGLASNGWGVLGSYAFGIMSVGLLLAAGLSTGVLH